MRAFKDLITKNNHQISKKRELDEKTLFFAFERVVIEWYGIKGKENIYPEDWKEGVLFIRVRSSLWLSEFLMEKEKLLRALHGFLGSEQVKEIRLKRG